jgi:phosphoribosylamine--glycine ligase
MITKPSTASSMNVMLLGSGGREHALAWKIAQSSLLQSLYIIPGNAGTSQCGMNVSIPHHDIEALKAFAVSHAVDMLVVGPEGPLVDGITDHFASDIRTSHIAVIGPSAKGAMLEGSKDFAKEFMGRHGIPTAEHKTFFSENIERGIDFIHHLPPPYVLKADGLAAGKGVIIAVTAEEAVNELYAMIKDRKFGEAGKKVIIEQYLDGIELSAFVLTDGLSYLILPSAKDYKRIGEGDTGPNTGGMGSISPVPFADDTFMKKVEDRIIRPTIMGLQKENIRYHGFIYFGLMNVDGDPFVIEYNIRMGDPEAECILPRLSSDLLALFDATTHGKLNTVTLATDPRFCTTVILVSKGYPGEYEKGKVITGIEKTKGSIVFHAGSHKDEGTGHTVTSGGRVLAVTSLAPTLQQALNASYTNAAVIDFEGKSFRKDLGQDLLKYYPDDHKAL